MPLLITHESFRDKLGAALAHAENSHAAQMICLEMEKQSIGRESGKDLDISGCGQDLAYISFTYGSTGRPKGVCIPHRGIVRLVKNTNCASFN